MAILVSRKRIENYTETLDHGGSRSVTRYEETLPNGRKLPILEVQLDQGDLDNTGTYTVPKIITSLWGTTEITRKIAA